MLSDSNNAVPSLFRIGIALCLAFHMAPSLLNLKDCYLSSGFLAADPYYSPQGLAALAQSVSDGAVYFFAGLLTVSWLCLLIGFKTRTAAILTTLCACFFYARNSFFLKTLAWDILLLSLVLLSVKHLSLLRLQFISIYFYTALSKIWPGNWLRENPVYYLLNWPVEGAVRNFWLRDWLATRADLCYGLGMAVIGTEFLVAAFLLIPRMRLWGIGLGIILHIFFSTWLHVPILFLLLFISTSLLFVGPCRKSL